MMRGTNKDTQFLVDYIPDNTIGAEIGVWRGLSSKNFLTKAKHLYMIDPWSIDAYDENNTGWVDKKTMTQLLAYIKPMVGSDKYEDVQQYYEDVYQEVKRTFASDPVTIFRGTSTEWFDQFTGRLDWIYIDGDHTFDGVYNDLKHSVEIVDQVIFCDDYNIIQHNDVRHAIQEFCLDYSLRPEPLLANQCMIKL